MKKNSKIGKGNHPNCRKGMANIQVPQPDGSTRPPAPAKDHEGKPSGALVHGGYSDIVLAPIVEEKKQEILDLIKGEGLSHIKPADRIAVGNLARCLARLERFDCYLEEKGDIVEGGKLNPVLKTYFTAINSTKLMLESLGLTPTARAKLGIDLAKTFDIAKAMQEQDSAE